MSASRAWSWRHAIIKSGLPATTRHVLLTISCYMNELGDGCYPTQKELAQATGLSERAVRDHTEVAIERGWLRRQEHGFRGQKWRNYEYCAAWPEPQDMEKGPEPDAAPSEKGPESHSTSSGTSHQKDRQEVPPTSPSTTPVTSPSRAPARAWEEGFYILWSEWPEGHRPDHRRTVEKLFSNLSDEERQQAVTGVKSYCHAMLMRGKSRRMVTYLRERLFRDFHDDPELDQYGYFVIKPGDAEWSAWLGAIRREYGESGVSSTVRLGYLRREQRWPDRETVSA